MKEIILLGRGPSWIDCPFDCETWAVSTVLLIPEIIPANILKVFSIDEYEQMKDALKVAKYWKIPIISTKDYADELYPVDDLIKEFGIGYIRNTMSYMIALAILRKYEKIKLYGVDQGPEWDYILNRPYVTFWIGMAMGRGIEVKVTENSLLMEPLISEIMKGIGLEKERAYKWLKENREKLVTLGESPLLLPR